MINRTIKVKLQVRPSGYKIVQLINAVRLDLLEGGNKTYGVGDGLSGLQAQTLIEQHPNVEVTVIQ